MVKRLKLLVPLALAIALISAPIAEAASSSLSGGPAAEVAKKKKKKKKKKRCKKKKRKSAGLFSSSASEAAQSAKKKKKKKKGKCKKKQQQKGLDGSPGLPGKPLSPTAPTNPTNPTNPPVQPQPRLVQGLTLTENPLLGGKSGGARVTLSGPAPTGGQAVTLGVDTPSRASVPNSVLIAEGQTQANFTVSTTAGPATTVVLTAASGASFKTAQLEIVDKATLESLELDHQCFPGDDLTNFGSNLVRFNVRAPDDAVVSLESSQPFALAVPPSVVVPEGSFTGVFTVNTLAAASDVTVTGTYDGVQRSDTASVRDENSPDPVAADLTLQPNSVVVGEPSTGTVSLDCEAPPGGINVSLSTTYPGLTVPSSVTVPAGQLSASFLITTVSHMTPGEATITATAGEQVQATLLLRAIGS